MSTSGAPLMICLQSAALSLAAASGGHATALAQAGDGAGASRMVGSTTAQASVDLFTRNRNISVRQRPRPDYEALGIRAGAFLVYPKVEVAQAFNDNIYAVATGETSDTILHFRPEVTVESNWSQHFVSLYGRGAINRHRHARKEDRDEFGVGGVSRLDVSRMSNLGLGAEFSRGFEPRTSPSAPVGSVRPIVFDTTSVFAVGAFTSGRIKLSSRIDLRRLDYANGIDPSGRTIAQDQRDRDVGSLLGRVDFATSPDAAVFVQIAGNRRDYDRGGSAANPARDSQGVEVLAGADFEVSVLVRGEVAVGYIRQDFDNPLYADAQRSGGRARIEYFASPLTTVTLGAGRTLEDAVTQGAGGYVSSSASITLDHELLRNLILSGRLTYASDRYEGIDRRDARLSASLGATYLVNRRLGLNASLWTQKIASDGLDRDQDFTINRLSLALVTQF